MTGVQTCALPICSWKLYKFTWVHPSIGVHKKLKFFSLKGCKNLKIVPRKFEIESLEILIFSICLKVKRIPPSLGKTRKVCQSFYWKMCGVWGLKRNWSKNGLHVNSKSWKSPKDSAKPEDGSRSMRHLVSYEEPQWGQRMWGEASWKRYFLPLYWMPYTNHISYINVEMTPGQ